MILVSVIAPKVNEAEVFEKIMASIVSLLTRRSTEPNWPAQDRLTQHKANQTVIHFGQAGAKAANLATRLHETRKALEDDA